MFYSKKNKNSQAGMAEWSKETQATEMCLPALLGFLVGAYPRGFESHSLQDFFNFTTYMKIIGLIF